LLQLIFVSFSLPNFIIVIGVGYNIFTVVSLKHKC